MINDSSYQLGAEVVFVFLIYDAISFGFVFLNQDDKLNRTWKKLIIMIIGIIIFAVSSSSLTLLVDVKLIAFWGNPYVISSLIEINMF
jgi:hypothetical protein